ncbi:MAG: hypothetical protein IAE89_14010 [Anaerolineae bacterium]|nr:hypothetical protein [Anaerolineae bacterium]
MKYKWLQKIVLTLLFLALVPALSAQDEAPILAISLFPRSVPEFTVETYIEAVDLGLDLGITGAALTYSWSDLEPESGQIDVSEPADNLTYLNSRANLVYEFGIQPLNTTDKETPDDLMDLPFDDPIMIARFEAFLNQLLPLFDERIRYFSIGNEVDVYLGNHPEEWSAFTTFYSAAANYARERAPWLQIGVTVTYGGIQAFPEEVAALNAVSDVLIVTYYPLGEGFSAENSALPETDFPAMAAYSEEFVRAAPVVLQEVGYPSGEINHSSESEQAEFVHHVFEAWSNNRDRIPFLNYFILHDFNEQLCHAFEAYYGLTDERFFSFLCTLGLLRADGTPKESLSVFAEEAAQFMAETP